MYAHSIVVAGLAASGTSVGGIQAAPGAVAMANTRVALLVGNSTYPELAFANPRNDVEFVAKAAREAGFDTLVIGLDLDVMELKQALGHFKKKASGAEVALVVAPPRQE